MGLLARRETLLADLAARCETAGALQISREDSGLTSGGFASRGQVSQQCLAAGEQAHNRSFF